MNSLTKALIEGLIDESESFNGKIVGMFGGGFKPPTIGHLEVVQRALSDYPEMDELIVLVGSGVRNSISQEESLAIWDIYKKSLPSKVKIMASPKNKPPIGAIYSYAKKNPNERIYWFLGEREGNEGDAEDIVNRTKSLRKLAYQNVKVKKIVTGGAVSGTKARQAVLNKDKEAFLQYIPDIPETDEIWDILTGVVKEQFLQERIAYDAETRMQTRFLMKQFLKTMGTKVEDATEGTLVGDEYELVYGFYPMKKGLGFMPFKVEGSAGPKDIAIEIKYNPELLNKKLYSELSAEIRNSVRHELEHLAQYRTEKGVRPGKDGVDQDDLPDVEYLTLDYEIPGHIQGLRTKAKAKKISLQQAIDDLFNSYEYDLAPEEEDFVRETWMNWLKTNMPGVSLTKIKEDFDQQDVEDLDNLADRELNPIDVDLSGNHFFDRLNDPRNNPEIDYLELEDFFTKLGDNREEFIDFLNKYKSVVATDTETNINIPFMKMANKAIAKTVMRKRNFKTPDEKIELEEKLTIGDKEVEKINKIGDNPEDWVIIYVDGSKEPYLNHLTEADPKKGTGKKPKGSGRRLYTDEDPKDTVGIKFSTRQDIVDTLNKTSFKNKSHARQSQVINLIHQRTRAAYGRAKKPEVKKRLKSALDYITKRKEASKAKTQRLKKQKTNESITKESLTPQILSLTQYMGSNGLDLKPYPKIKFIDNNQENAEDLFGRTAYYDPNAQLVALYTMGRHPKDILRSYAHELIHHHQNLNGTLQFFQTTNTNEDGDLERIEREAYEEGNILFRNWEDQMKNEK